jgi:hypothetical protein
LWSFCGGLLAAAEACSWLCSFLLSSRVLQEFRLRNSRNTRDLRRPCATTWESPQPALIHLSGALAFAVCGGA